MNKCIRLAALLAVGIVACLPYRAQASNSVNPSDVEITIYDLYLSPHTDCSSAIHVFSNPGATAQNMVSGPTFDSGSIPKGTYPCAILGIRDNITAIPASNTDSLNCLTTQPLTLQLCRPPDHTQNPLTGVSINCTSSPMEAYVYMSTVGSLVNSGVSGGLWTAALPGPLTAPIVVTGDHALTFVMDFDGQVVDNGTSCDCQPPTMSVR